MAITCEQFLLSQPFSSQDQFKPQSINTTLNTIFNKVL